MKLLIINPGSTSTKVGVFEQDVELFAKNIQHDVQQLSLYSELVLQFPLRKAEVLKFLDEQGVSVQELAAVVGRGGLLKPLAGGTYAINQAMKSDLLSCKYGTHASNLGALIADDIASQIGKPCFVVDPVVVDEMHPLARLSGHSQFARRSIFHALNQKAMARQYCIDKGVQYTDVSLIVVHMGGGISVGVHYKGQVIDVNNALDGDGPYGPERSGGLPAGELVNLCYSQAYTIQQVKDMLVGAGGMVSYCGSNNIKEIAAKAQSDAQAQLYIDGMIYQVAKEIGAMATTISGKVDAIILTGGIAHSQYITQSIKERVRFVTDNVVVQAGENELKALAQGAVRVLNGSEQAKQY
jgi:butyrate kinase